MRGRAKQSAFGPIGLQAAYALVCLLFSWVATADEVGKVNPSLAKFQQGFKPRLEKMGQRVYMAFGYDYANFAFIEGDDGVIVVDTGWFSGQVQPAVDAFRSISNKPVVAVIYTHVHSDHTGGSGVFARYATDGLAVYAHEDWRERIHYDSSSVQPMIARRAFSQMGFVLPEGPEGTVGSGIGPVARANGESSFVAPTVDVGEKFELVISGVRVQMWHAPADIKSNLLVWLPEERVLFSGDSLGGTLPYIATPRFEPDRDPRDFISTIELMQGLPAEYIVPGHGRPIVGRQDVQDVLKANRDIIQFLADQVERHIILGYTADEIIDNLQLPAALATHPDLQPHYHRMDWIIRGLYTKHAGWAADNQELLRLSHSEEAKRLIAMLGGPDKLLQHAEDALRDGDPRWSATLANIHARSGMTEESDRAQEILISAYREIAFSTDSASERNYLLTAVKDMESPIPWPRLFLNAERRNMEPRSNADILSSFGVRLAAEDVLNEELTVQVVVNRDSNRYVMHVSNGVLRVLLDSPQVSQGQFSIDRDDLVSVAIRETSWRQLLDSGKIDISICEREVKQLLSVIE